MDRIPFDDLTELLYIRLTDEECMGDGVVPLAVGIPDWSCNRARFSKPEDVLIADRPEYTRIGEFAVGDIPESIEPDEPDDGGNKPAKWFFWAEHVPQDDNYSHSEVRMRMDGKEYKRNKNIGSSVYKSKVRRRLAQMVRVRP